MSVSCVFRAKALSLTSVYFDIPFCDCINNRIWLIVMDRHDISVAAWENCSHGHIFTLSASFYTTRFPEQKDMIRICMYLNQNKSSCIF